MEHAFLLGGFMLEEKGKILIHRLVWLILLIIGIVVSIYCINSEIISFDFIDIVIIVSLYVDAMLFAMFIASLCLSYKVYEYRGSEIVVYAGWYHHYIKVDGIKTDEHNTLVSFSAINLSCVLDDGTDIKVTITLTNRISLKINDRLYTKTK